MKIWEAIVEWINRGPAITENATPPDYVTAPYIPEVHWDQKVVVQARQFLSNACAGDVKALTRLGQITDNKVMCLYIKYVCEHRDEFDW